MSDPPLAGVATLGRIRDLHKSKMAAIEIGSNSKVAITFDIIQLEGCWAAIIRNGRYFDPAK